MSHEQATAWLIVFAVFAAMGVFAALGIPAAIRSGLHAIANALDGIRREMHDFNEARRLTEIIERSKKP